MKRNAWLPFLALAATVLVGCGRVTPAWETAEVDADVYAAVLNRISRSSVSGPDSVMVIDDSTTLLRGRVLQVKNWDNAQPLVGEESLTVRQLEAFSQRSRPLRALDDLLRTRVHWPLVFSGQQDYSRMMASMDTVPRTAGQPDALTERYWRAFSEKFPGAIGTVSLSQLATIAQVIRQCSISRSTAIRRAVSVPLFCSNAVRSAGR